MSRVPYEREGEREVSYPRKSDLRSCPFGYGRHRLPMQRSVETGTSGICKSVETFPPESQTRSRDEGSDA